jgi:hypothetical protein
LTGTFGGSIKNAGGGTGRSYPFTYTISSANTWELKSLTVPGYTTGTWNNTNGLGINVGFGLGVGPTLSGTAGSWQAADLISETGTVSVIGTAGATWQITGVQFEVGTVATPFERRPYGTELALCQRYFYRLQDQATYGIRYGGISPVFVAPFPVTMRATPTVSPVLVNTGYVSAGTVNALVIDGVSTDGARIQVNTSTVSVDFIITYNYTASSEL